MMKDLTREHPDKILWRFLLPMLVSVMFQQIYNIADSCIAGRFAGEDALAAVGASYPITVIFMAFAVGTNLGASVVVSRLFGAKDMARMKSAVSTAFVACAFMSFFHTHRLFLLRQYDEGCPHTGKYLCRRTVILKDLCLRHHIFTSV